MRCGYNQRAGGISDVIGFMDGEEVLSAAAPTVEEALEAARTLIAQGKLAVTMTNSITGEVSGTQQVEQARARRDRP